MGTYFGNNNVKVYLGDKLVSGEELNPFPVGSIYMSIDSTSPAEYYGGTWEQIAGGRTLMGAGTGTDVDGTSKTITAEETGGSYNMSKHCHGLPTGYSRDRMWTISTSEKPDTARVKYSLVSYGSGKSGNV
jgi:hypothetical protein